MGWRKVFLDIKCYVILKTSALVSLCCNEGGESALSPRGSGACRGDIPIVKRFDGDDSFAIPILYIER